MKTLCVGLVLVLVMTFAAPLLSFADSQLSLSMTTNSVLFAPDSKLEVSVSIENPVLHGGGIYALRYYSQR